VREKAGGRGKRQKVREKAGGRGQKGEVD